MFFRYVSGFLVLVSLAFFLWGDRMRMMQGDLMAGLDYPLAAYEAYNAVITKYPKSPLRQEAEKRKRDLVKGNSYLQGLLEKEKRKGKKGLFGTTVQDEAAKKYH